METVTDFIFLGCKITSDGDSSDEIKMFVLLWKKSYKNLDSVLKKQRYHFADKSLYSQSYGFPVVMYQCESWIIKKLSVKELMLLNFGFGDDS